MLLTLLTLISFARANECPDMTLIAEFHSVNNVPSWIALVNEAERGQCLVVFEGFSRAVNENSRTKAKAFERFATSANGYANVYGMDSNELKGLSIAGELYLANRAGGDVDPGLENAFHGILQEGGVLQRLRLYAPLRKWKGLLEPLSEHRLRLRLAKLSTGERGEFYLQTYNAFVRMTETAGLAPNAPDLENDFASGQKGADFHRFSEEMMSLRDAYMAQSLEQITCADVLRRPLKVSLGVYHVPGLVRELRLRWPNIEPKILGLNLSK